MTYEETIAALDSIPAFPGKPGLERMQQLLERLGNPHQGLKYVHVAGTNGKGSTCALLAGVLSAAGYRTGLYTSPHLTDFAERIRVNGEEIPHADVVRLAERVMEEAGRCRAAGAPLTEFEVITAMAFLWFREQGCEICVLETGLGGRCDATNVIESPEVTVITSISLDHTKILGDTVEQIAFEKSGILKSFYRELGTILSIYVLRITLNHDVINFTVLVQIDSIKSKISNDLALESTGLTSIATYIGNIHVLICPSLLLSCIRLTVDVYQRNVCCNYFISNGSCGRRVNRVDNHNINTLSDEVIDLSGLGSLVISTIYDFNVLSFESLALQIALQLGTEQGHEVISELINTYTNFFVCQITIYCISCCISGICCVCFLSCCILSSCRFGGCFFLFAAASCDYRSYHGQCKYKTYCFSFHCYSTSQMNVVTLGY